MKKWRRAKPIRYLKRSIWHDVVGRAAAGVLGVGLITDGFFVLRNAFLMVVAVLFLFLPGLVLLLGACVPVRVLDRHAQQQRQRRRGVEQDAEESSHRPGILPPPCSPVPALRGRGPAARSLRPP